MFDPLQCDVVLFTFVMILIRMCVMWVMSFVVRDIALSILILQSLFLA